MLEISDGGLVEIIQELGVEAVAVDGQGGEVTLFKKRADQVSHEILGAFQGEKGRRLVEVGKTSQVVEDRPVEADHAAGEAAHGQKGDRLTAVGGRSVQKLEVREVIGTLGG